MFRLDSKLNLFAFVVFFFAFASLAHAQIQRTFVSTSGSDAGNCVPSAPCRSFAYALTQTASNGEIVALTSGGYGPVEVTKAVQITAPTGVYVAITTLPATAIGGTDAIRVNAGVNDRVVLRGLTLNNVGVTNANGITFPSGGSLFVESCVINGFDRQGISVARSTADDVELFVTDTVIRNGDLTTITDNAGIFLRSTGTGIVRTTIDNCRLERAGYVGLWSLENTRTTVRNTVASHNGFGFGVSASTGTTAEMNLENCTVTHSAEDGIFVGNGSFAGGTATARLSNTVSANNGNDGIIIAGNGIAHISDSTINGNGDDGVGVRANAIARISTSTINNNGGDGIQLSNVATSRAIVTSTTIFGNAGKGLNRQGAVSVATSIGSNRIFDNTGGSDAFSSTIAQQ